jgi:hypothetical protein
MVGQGCKDDLEAFIAAFSAMCIIDAVGGEPWGECTGELAREDCLQMENVINSQYRPHKQ